MCQQHKVPKPTRKKDQLIELPEGILYTIISKLTLKEAVRTSSLSKAWRFVWICHPELLLDSDNVLVLEKNCDNVPGNTTKSHRSKRFQRCKFIEIVDHIIDQRFRGPKIDSLTIRYGLGEDSSPHISEWIQKAVMKGVEEINLDFYGFIRDGSSSATYERYKFPCFLLASFSNKSTIKQLQLASCTLSQIPCSNSLKSLVTIVLRDARITDLQMERFQLACPSVERIALNNCEDLVNIKISSLRLKFLSILNCWRLESVNIRAEDLLTLDYTGQWVKFSFDSVPRLAEVFLSFTGISRDEGVAYALSRLKYDLPQLASLNLVCLTSLKYLKFPENVQTFLNIKQLLLTVFPFHDEDKLLWTGYILKAFPLLCKLDINLFSPSYIKQCKRIDRDLSKCPHGHLIQLVINGFNGYLHEVELLKYLLDNIIELKVLVISPCRRLYKGFHTWDEERRSMRFKLSENIVKWLHMTVAPGVDLRIQ